MKGDKAQARPKRRTPPFREAHEGRHMKGDKWRETRHRQDRRGRHHHSGRQMKGEKAQTRPERRTLPCRETHEGRQDTDKTGEADTTIQDIQGDK